MAYKQGDVVLVPFPFRERLAEAPRPTVVVSVDAYNGQGDLVIAAITSHAPRGPLDYGLLDWAAAGLKRPRASGCSSQPWRLAACCISSAA